MNTTADIIVGSGLLLAGIVILIREFKPFDPSPGRNAQLRRLLNKTTQESVHQIYDSKGKVITIR